MAGLALVAVLLLAPALARADDPFEKMATPPPAPQPLDPATQRSMQDMQRRLDAAQRDAARRAQEEVLLRRGTTADVERHRVETERQDTALEELERLDRKALERVTKPAPPSEAAAVELDRAQEREALEKRTGVVEQKVRVRERRERETPTNPH